MEKKYKTWAFILSSLGLAGGIVYSVAKKETFWKGVGNTVIFSLAGMFTGVAVDSFAEKAKPEEEENKPI
jgi:4-hydroxybenzoate polyprenyltransferase